MSKLKRKKVGSDVMTKKSNLVPTNGGVKSKSSSRIPKGPNKNTQLGNRFVVANTENSRSSSAVKGKSVKTNAGSRRQSPLQSPSDPKKKWRTVHPKNKTKEQILEIKSKQGIPLRYRKRLMTLSKVPGPIKIYLYPTRSTVQNLKQMNPQDEETSRSQMASYSEEPRSSSDMNAVKIRKKQSDVPKIELSQPEDKEKPVEAVEKQEDKTTKSITETTAVSDSPPKGKTDTESNVSAKKGKKSKKSKKKGKSKKTSGSPRGKAHSGPCCSCEKKEPTEAAPVKDINTNCEEPRIEPDCTKVPTPSQCMNPSCRSNLPTSLMYNQPNPMYPYSPQYTAPLAQSNKCNSDRPGQPNFFYFGGRTNAYYNRMNARYLDSQKKYENLRTTIYQKCSIRSSTDSQFNGQNNPPGMTCNPALSNTGAQYAAYVNLIQQQNGCNNGNTSPFYSQPMSNCEVPPASSCGCSRKTKNNANGFVCSPTNCEQWRKYKQKIFGVPVRKCCCRKGQGQDDNQLCYTLNIGDGIGKQGKKETKSSKKCDSPPGSSTSSQHSRPGSAKKGKKCGSRPGSAKKGKKGGSRPGSANKGKKGGSRPGSAKKGKKGGSRPGSAKKGKKGRSRPGSAKKGKKEKYGQNEGAERTNGSTVETICKCEPRIPTKESIQREIVALYNCLQQLNCREKC